MNTKEDFSWTAWKQWALDGWHRKKWQLLGLVVAITAGKLAVALVDYLMHQP